MERMTMKIDGMSCSHCVKAVHEALAELRRDSVQWSQKATTAAASPRSTAGSAPARGAVPPEHDGHELEQQAAGILKRRSRRRV